jgi:hypothetical protein
MARGGIRDAIRSVCRLLMRRCDGRAIVQARPREAMKASTSTS